MSDQTQVRLPKHFGTRSNKAVPAHGSDRSERRQGRREEAKQWVTAFLIGLVVLLTVNLILRFADANGAIEHGQALLASDGRGTNVIERFPSLGPQIAGKRCLVVMLGSCSGCALLKYRRGSELQNRYDYVLEVYDSRGSGELPKSQGNYIVVADLDGCLHKELRAFLPPRGYETDPDGTVARAETGGRQSQMFRRD